jgi:hypothetical protein
MLQNIKDNKVLPVMHGENFLVPVDKMPEGKTSRTKMFIVGHSETGHNHVLESETPFAVFEEELYLQLFKPAKLVHTKSFDIHETVEVMPGVYKVNHKTEYNPFTKVIDRVFD